MSSPDIALVISTLNAGIHRTEALLRYGWHQTVIVHQITDGRQTEYADQHARLRQSGAHIIVQQFGGLSKSRNAGLDAVTADYALITDDDVQFPDDVVSRIRTAIDSSQHPDILTLCAETPEGEPFKRYPKNAAPHTLRTAARVSSIEMVIAVSWWKKKQVRFHERFGLGADYPTGEEYVFMSAAIRSGARAWYFPAPVVIHPALSSGRVMHAEQLFNKGAMLQCVFGRLALPYLLAFAWRKRDMYKNTFSLTTAIRHLMAGSKHYRAHD